MEGWTLCDEMKVVMTNRHTPAVLFNSGIFSNLKRAIAIHLLPLSFPLLLPFPPLSLLSLNFSSLPFPSLPFPPLEAGHLKSS